MHLPENIKEDLHPCVMLYHNKAEVLLLFK